MKFILVITSQKILAIFYYKPQTNTTNRSLFQTYFFYFFNLYYVVKLSVRQIIIFFLSILLRLFTSHLLVIPLVLSIYNASIHVCIYIISIFPKNVCTFIRVPVVQDKLSVQFHPININVALSWNRMVSSSEPVEEQLSGVQRGLRFVCRVARASLPFQVTYNTRLK